MTDDEDEKANENETVVTETAWPSLIALALIVVMCVGIWKIVDWILRAIGLVG